MSTSIDDALLPCPFCGDAPSVETHAAGEGWSGNERRIVCRNKECFGPATAWYGDDEARIAAWNRRSAIASRQAVVSPAASDVLAERERQVTAEGWTPEHDDEHDHGELAYAAACYALAATGLVLKGWLRDIIARLWPWDSGWFKHTDKRRSAIKAGALILAEIERLDRRALAQQAKPQQEKI